MSTTSVKLLLTLQELDDNPDTWGDVLNASTIELLEDALAGMSTATLASTADYTMDTTAGGDASGGDHYRMMILQADGSPGGPTNIIVPAKTKVYLVWNNTGDSSTVTVKTLSGSGVAVPPTGAYWVYCDGTDVLPASTASAATATTAATATNALSLGGILANLYGPINVANTWTAGQVVTRTTLADVSGDITPNLALSNSFYHKLLQGENLAAPTGATNGAQFSLVIEQGTGAPWTLTYQASTFMFASGVAPTLSTAFGAIDYLSFEYCTNVTGTAKWIGSVIKNVSVV